MEASQLLASRLHHPRPSNRRAKMLPPLDHKLLRSISSGDKRGGGGRGGLQDENGPPPPMLLQGRLLAMRTSYFDSSMEVSFSQNYP